MRKKNLVRQFNAFFLLLSVWMSAVAFFPASASAQEKQKPQTQTDRKEDKNTNTEAKPSSTPIPLPTSSGKPLSPKEDPNMIGKRNINSGSDKFFGWLGGSQQREIAIGRQLALEVEQQAKMIDDPMITEYVNRVGQNIVLHSDAKVPFTIKVIDSDEVNAFALPGGYFFVNKGLILAADNEAELAGVMAHEIAHVTARHAMENQGKMQAIQYGLLGTMIFGGGIAAAIAQNAGGLGQMLAFFKFSRAAEQEADNLGVQYLYAAGYDPTAMATMFEKIESLNKKKPGSLSKLFTTHPQSVERRDNSLALVARFPEKEEYVISTSEFQRVKAYLLRISNAKALSVGDLNNTADEPGRPTLKRRQPDPTDSTTDSSGSSSSSSSSDDKDKKDSPPQLKRRTESPPPPQPQPSPSPE